MPLDGIFLSKLCGELQRACECRIDKISQPSRDELVLSLRSAAFSGRLLLSARPGAARVHLTEFPPENPARPPMFCMLMRKHLLGGKILSVSQYDFERVLRITVSATDEMGEKRDVSLICELIGNRSNIILVGQDGRIIDCVRRSDIESGGRMVQPGALYTLPDAPYKISISKPDVTDAVLSHTDLCLSAALLDTIAGISPLTANEIAFACCGQDAAVKDMTDAEKNALAARLRGIKNGDYNTPYLIYGSDGTPKDFSYMPITQYGGLYTGETVPGYCLLLDKFYSERDRMYRLKHSASDVFKTLQNASARTEKKLLLRKKELEKCAGRDKYRIYGELIKANLHLINPGDKSACVPNYYDENLSNIIIPLNPALSPIANSARYFKEYRKLCSAEHTLGKLITEAQREKEYLSSVSDALARAETAGDILDIRDELIASGYIRSPRQKQPKRPAAKPISYTSSDGFTILVGRNNVQNDLLTLKTADKDDIWLHTKNIPGSHVIISCGGEEVPESTLLEAAAAAAYHSQARASSQVPIDYTRVRNVKKPSGAKPGMVIYKTNRTVFVNPAVPDESQSK